MKAIKDFFGAFFTNPHVQAIKNLADANKDGKVDLEDLQEEVARVKADLQQRQASYYNAGLVALAAFAGGAYAGHRFL
jgi:hypothetical protein